MSTRRENKSEHREKRRARRRRTMGFLLKTLYFIHYCFDYIIDYAFAFFYRNKRQYIAAPTNGLLLTSATVLARKIRAKEVKCLDVVTAYVDRLHEVNSALNAVVACAEDALLRAKEIDDDIASGKITDKDFESKPFLGVPFTSKESTAAKGMPFTFGLRCRRGVRAPDDADVVAALKGAGAILIGVTNVPQVNMWQETSNPVYGITNNPYNTTRNVGGSSGGEGSIIAACGSPLGIGTDVGGSLRIPAFMCGIYGLKPTAGLISTKGLTFRKGDEGKTMVTAGPMVKYAEDITPLLKVFLGPNVTKLRLDESVDVTELKVFYIQESNDLRMSPIRNEMKKIFRRAVNHFSSISDDQPEQLHMPDIKYGGKIWRYFISQEPQYDFSKALANRQGQVNGLVEAVKHFLFLSDDYTAGAIWKLIDDLLPQADEKWARNIAARLRTELIEQLGTNGILIYPSAPFPASYHHTALIRPWNFFYFAIWNALDLPVVQVPLGLGAEGLPLGVQVVAAPYQEHLCIAAAKELEKAFGGFVPPLTSSNK